MEGEESKTREQEDWLSNFLCDLCLFWSLHSCLSWVHFSLLVQRPSRRQNPFVITSNGIRSDAGADIFLFLESWISRNKTWQLSFFSIITVETQVSSGSGSSVTEGRKKKKKPEWAMPYFWRLQAAIVLETFCFLAAAKCRKSKPHCASLLPVLAESLLHMLLGLQNSAARGRREQRFSSN